MALIAWLRLARPTTTRSTFRVLRNGVKAVSTEATARRATPEVIAARS